MKNLFFVLTICTIFSFSAFAHEPKLEKKASKFIEYKIIENGLGVDTCYIRYCWNVGTWAQTCTEWVEVPCDQKITLEGDRLKDI